MSQKPIASLNKGQTVGPYSIVQMVGTGGMGEVYEAWDDSLKRKVAIKILTLGSLTSDDEVRARFVAEGRNLAKLKHPNVVNLYLIGQHEQRPFMAMEFVDGVTLDEFIKSHPCGLKETLKLFRQMVDGLAAAHREGIIHRDIKPQNIMVDAVNSVRIVDFGIAKSHLDDGNNLTQQGLVVGTKGYVAPEVLRGAKAGPQADIFSLGLVLNFMLTGETPRYDELGAADLGKTKVMQAKRLRDLLPASLQNILNGMTHKSPELRYRSLQEILADLEEVSLEGMHSDLLVESDRGVKVQDIEKIYEECRKKGFDVAEAHLVVNLATKLEAKTEAVIETAGGTIERQVILDDDAIAAAMERIKNAKTQVVAQRVSHQLNAQPEQPPFYPDSKPIHWPRVGALAFLIITTLYYAGVTPKAMENWFSALITPPRREMKTSTAQAAPSVKAVIAPAPAPATAGASPSAPVEILAVVPKLRIGQTFQYTYELTDPVTGARLQAQTLEWELTREAGGRYSWRDNHDSSEVFGLNPFVAPYQSSGNSFRPAAKLEIFGSPEKFFPLSEGKTGTYKVRPAGQSAGYDVKCTAIANERTTTPAGSFKTVRVDCSATGLRSYDETYFYSPQLHHWVKKEATYGYGATKQRLIVQLIGYSLPDPHEVRKPAGVYP